MTEDDEVIGERIIGFLGPVQDSIIAAERFDVAWSPGGASSRPGHSREVSQ